jgi:transcription elongation GreA/GreB family factor
LRFLTTKKRKEIALRFKEAFEFEGFPDGDIMDEELFVESRIKQINNVLARARIIDKPGSCDRKIAKSYLCC